MFDSVFSKVISGFLCTAFCYQTYISLPLSVFYGSNNITPLPSFQQDAAVIIFPGFSGPDENIARIEQSIDQSDKERGYSRFVMTYDWSRWRGGTLRAAVNSKIIGKKIGEQLATQKQQPLKELHVIGVSVGAFAADSCIKEYQRQTKLSSKPLQKTKTRLTLLDPFTSLGLFGAGYGQKYFGTECDYCEHYVNTDDPVPFTSDPLPNAMNFDVTKSKERESYQPGPGDSMHSWPTAFYGLNWKKMIDPRLKNPLFQPSHDVGNSRGTVTALP